MENKEAAPNGYDPDPPVGFVVKVQQMVRCEQKDTADDKYYKMDE